MNMPQTQTFTDPVGNFKECFRFPDFQRPVGAKVAIDDFMYSPRARAHDDDLRGKKHRFRNRVRDENHGLARRGP